MDTKQKVAACIIVPLFAFATAHTLLNKKFSKQETKTENVQNNSFDNSLRISNDSAVTIFRAEQNMDSLNKNRMKH